MNESNNDAEFRQVILRKRRLAASAAIGALVVVLCFAVTNPISFAGSLQQEPPPRTEGKKGASSSNRKGAKKDTGTKKAPAASKALPEDSKQEEKWQAELGDDGRILHTAHFAIVHNTDEEAAGELGKSFESTYRACQSYMSRLGLTAKSPKSKLLVLYFDQRGPHGQLLKRLGQETLPPGEFGAYYPDLHISVFFNFHNAQDRKPSDAGGQGARARMLAKRQGGLVGQRDLLNAQRQASSQVLWNIGYYGSPSPAATPRWLIEGTGRLFMTAELDETKGNAVLGAEQMQGYLSLTKADKHIPARDLISDSEQFTKQGATALAAGTESWALISYLSSKKRAGQLKQYILSVQDRPKGYKSTPEEEIAAFEKAFGTLDAQWEAGWREWMNHQAKASSPGQ